MADTAALAHADLLSLRAELFSGLDRAQHLWVAVGVDPHREHAPLPQASRNDAATLQAGGP